MIDIPMERWNYFLFLASQTQIVWPTTVLFLGLSIFSTIRNYTKDNIPFRVIHLLALIPFLCPPIILLAGTFLEKGTSSSLELTTGQLSAMVWGILALQLIINIGCFLWFKGLRAGMVMLTLAQAPLTFLASFVAAMSISGIWL